MHAKGRKLPWGAVLAFLTLGEARGSAKLQKEHTFGHGNNPRYIGCLTGPPDVLPARVKTLSLV